MHFSTLFTLVAVAASATAQTLTAQYACAPAGAYTLCQNLWGMSSGVGQQNSTLISTSGNTISWRTQWSWQNNPNNVKSYANVLHNSAKGIQLQNVRSAPTVWQWTHETESQGIRVDVSYDIWLGVQPQGDPATRASSYEIMIWLAGKGGIQPVGSQILSGLNIAGHTWNLWKGPNSNWQVLSFVSANGDINDFNVDLKQFFDYLVQNQGVAATQYIQAIQAGTEPFTGSANLLTTSYSVSVN